MYLNFSTVITEPDDVTVCEGGSTTFTCVLDSSITSSDVQWRRSRRLLKDTGTTERLNTQPNDDFSVVCTATQNSFTTSLKISNAIKSYTGYYWVRLPLGDVCNVSLSVTVGTGTYV